MPTGGIQRVDTDDQSRDHGGRLERFSAKALLVALAIVLSLVFAELVSRFYLRYVAAEESFRRYASMSELEDRYGSSGRFYAPHPYLRYYLTPGFTRGPNRHNSLGYRGEEIRPKRDGEYRIVCLGGSTTYTSMVSDYKLSYPYLLQEHLVAAGLEHVTVINSGTPGWNSWQTLMNLAFRVLDVDPDMLIVYHAVNDVPPRIVWPPESYRGDNTGWLASDFWLRYQPSIVDGSTLMRILRIRLGLAPSQNSVNWLDPEASTAYSAEFEDQTRRGVYPDGLFRKVPVRQMLDTNRPVFFRRNLENLVNMARSRGIEVVLATFAHLNRHQLGDVKQLGSQDSEEFFSAIAEANEIIRQIAANGEARLFDFAGAFPADPELYATVPWRGADVRDPYHVNEDGARLKAALFADFLTTNELIPPPSATDRTPVHSSAAPESANRSPLKEGSAE